LDFGDGLPRDLQQRYGLPRELEVQKHGASFIGDDD
jgi:hypothetical protein